MPFEKSVLVPLNADETFALITQPDRLRRWQVITARVDLRAGGGTGGPSFLGTRPPAPSPRWNRAAASCSPGAGRARRRCRRARRL